MATRFGAVSPAQTFATRVRWLVACLVAVILTLIGTVVFLVKGDPQTAQNPTPSVANAAVQAASPTVDILVAVTRIEEGAQVSEAMVTTQPMHPDRVPEGAMLATEKGELLGKYANKLIRPNLPLLREDIAAARPISMINIPPGFRAVTITVDSRTGVEGWAKPNSRVDVLWTYKDPQDKATKVTTICRFVKILSVSGQVNVDQQGRAVVAGKGTTVTVLVSEKDAQKIELARSLGELSLALVGEQVTTGNTDAGMGSPITVDSLLGKAPEPIAAEVPIQGKMLSTDPKTGKMISYVLKQGRWVPESASSAQ